MGDHHSNELKAQLLLHRSSPNQEEEEEMESAAAAAAAEQEGSGSRRRGKSRRMSSQARGLCGACGRCMNELLGFGGLLLVGLVLGLTLPTNPKLTDPTVARVSNVLGWTYFLAWTVSFYPQVRVRVCVCVSHVSSGWPHLIWIHTPPFTTHNTMADRHQPSP